MFNAILPQIMIQSAPPVIAFMVAAVLATKRFGRHTDPFRFTQLACTVKVVGWMLALLCQATYYQRLDALLPGQSVSEFHSANTWLMNLSTLFGVGSHTAGLGLLIAALFADRR
jgi:hypothetical protein